MILTIDWERDAGYITLNGAAKIQCTCQVRNELNGKRKLSEKPVLTETFDGSEGVPYMPRKFPFGVWEITGIVDHTAKGEDGRPLDPYLFPYFVRTDAHQRVERWNVMGGHYVVPSGEFVDDWGYGLHCSTSLTTLGCGRINMIADLETLIDLIKQADKAMLVVR